MTYITKHSRIRICIVFGVDGKGTKFTGNIKQMCLYLTAYISTHGLLLPSVQPTVFLPMVGAKLCCLITRHSVDDEVVCVVVSTMMGTHNLVIECKAP